MENVTCTPAQAGRHLLGAARKGVVASVAVETGGGWRLCRARLLGCNLHRGALWCERPAPLSGAGSIPLSADQRLALRFACLDRRLTLQSRLRRLMPLVREGRRVELAEIALPEEIVCENLRLCFRVRIEDGTPYRMVLWAMDMQQRLDPDAPVKSFAATVRDLSIGGASVGDFEREPDWPVGQHVGAELHTPETDEPLRLFAQVRRITRPADRPLSCGLIFLGAETPLKTFAVQETLARLVSQQQRRQLSRRIEGPA